MGLFQFFGFSDHAQTSAGRGGKHHFRPQEPHQLTSLDAEGFRHGDYQRIAFLGAHHGQSDPRITARCLDHGLAWL